MRFGIIFAVLLSLSSYALASKVNQKLICDGRSSFKSNTILNSCINVGYTSNYYIIYKNQYNSIKPKISTNPTELHFSIYPSLPEGLNLNSGTGEISGIPKNEQFLQNYVVTVRYHLSKPIKFFVSISIVNNNQRSLENEEFILNSEKHFKPFIHYKQESYEFFIGFDDSTDEALWLNPEEEASLIYSFGDSNSKLPTSITIDEETGKINGIAPLGTNGTYVISVIVQLNTSLETKSNPYYLTINIIQPYCPSSNNFPIAFPGEKVEGTCDGGKKYATCPTDSKSPVYSRPDTKECNVQFTYDSYTFRFYAYFMNSSSEANLGGGVGNFVMEGVPDKIKNQLSIDEYGVITYDGRNSDYKSSSSARITIKAKAPDDSELSVKISCSIILNKCAGDQEYSTASIGERSISKIGCRDGYTGAKKFRECLATSYPAEWSEDQGCELGPQITYPKTLYTYYYNFYDSYAKPNSKEEFEQYYITAGVLPNGLMIHPNGTISGIPQQGGIFEVTIQGRNGEYTSNYLNLTIFVYEPLCEDESGKVAHSGEYFKNYTECPKLYEGYVGYYCMLDKLDPQFSPNNTGMEYCTAIRTLAPTTPFVPVDYTYTAFTVFLNGIGKKALSVSEDNILINSIIDVFSKIDDKLYFTENDILITLMDYYEVTLLRFLQGSGSYTEIVVQITHEKSETSAVSSALSKLVSDSSLLVEVIKDYADDQFSGMTSVVVKQGAKKYDGSCVSNPIVLMMLLLIMILL